MGSAQHRVLSPAEVRQLYPISELRERAAQRRFSFTLWDHFNQACRDFLKHPEEGFVLPQDIQSKLRREWTRIPAAAFVDIKGKSLPFMEECALAAKRTDHWLPPLIMPLRHKKLGAIKWEDGRILGPGYKCHKNSPLVSTIFSFEAKDDFAAAANAHEPVYLIGTPEVTFKDDPKTQDGRLIPTIWVPSGGVYKGELPPETLVVLDTQPSGFVPPSEFELD